MIQTNLRRVLLLLFLAVSSSGVLAGPSWKLVTPLVKDDGINAIAWGDPGYVAVGDRGFIFSSPDGLTWTQRISGIPSNLNGVIWSPLHNEFVTIGDSGVVLYSADGLTWQAFSDTGPSVNDIIWNVDRNEYLLVGSGGLIWTTQDSLTVSQGNASFSVRASNISSALRAAVWDDVNKRYLVVGDKGTVLSSNNATIWKREQDGIKNIATLTLTDIAYNPIHNRYMMTGEGLGLWSSPANLDDANYQRWTVAKRDPSTTTLKPVTLSSVVAHPVSGVLVAVGGNGVILSSATGGARNWRAQTSRVVESLRVGFWDQNNQQIIVGGQNSRILSSPDGLIWSVGTSWVNAVLNHIVYDPGPDPVASPEKALYVAVGSRETIISSADSIDWDVLQTGLTIPLHSVAFNPAATGGQQRYVAVGAGGKILASSDGVSWAAQTSHTAEDLFAVIWEIGKSQYTVVGNAGTLLTSPDGVNWTVKAGIPGTVDLRAILWDTTNQRYLTAGVGGAILSSSDGVNWTVQVSGVTEDLLALTRSASPSLYIASGNAGTLISSPDGVNWTAQSSGVTVPLRSVAWDPDGALYMAVGESGVILTSADGVAWLRQSNSNGRDLSSVFWDKSLNQYLSVGELGTILRRDIEPPVIALLGADPAELAQGIEFNDPGSIVTDNIDVGLTTVTDIDLGVAPIGNHVVTYSVRDVSGNDAIPVKRTVIITDQTPPTITLLEDRVPFLTPLGLSFIDPGANITDNVELPLTVIFMDQLLVIVNFLFPQIGESEQSVLAQNIANIAPPPQSPLFVNLKFEEITALSSKLSYTINSDLDINALGVYTLTYDASDGVGNISDTVVRTVEVVNDTTPPVISVIGNSQLSLLLGTNYRDLGVTAVDAVDGAMTDKVDVDNPLINVNNPENRAVLTVGTFDITYTVTDRSGNTAVAVRTVTVDPIVKDQSGGGVGIWFLLCLVLLVIEKAAVLRARRFAVSPHFFSADAAGRTFS